MVIDYQALLDEAMLSIVKRVLTRLQNEESDDERSLYIAFLTNTPGVLLSKRMKGLYPNEMTIVLQYQFRDLYVADDFFSVSLSFNGIYETVKVPFCSIISFIDPLANFSIQFDRVGAQPIGNLTPLPIKPPVKHEAKTTKLKKTSKTTTKNNAPAEIIAFKDLTKKKPSEEIKE